MTHRFLDYKSSLISYYVYGSGPGKVICLHGYGENATTFDFFEKYAGNQFTFYSIDLPFHGDTKWNEGFDFSEAGLVEITEYLIGDQEFTLIGFSLGGRMALSIYQHLSKRVNKLILMAPDGMKVNFWYWLATQSSIGNRLFDLTMKKPGWFFGLLKLLNKLGTVNSSIYKFVTYYIGDASIRQLLYKRWTTLRKIRPDISKIKTLIRLNMTATRLIYGKHDRIILSSRAHKFKTGIEDLCTLNIIQSGHQVLHEKHVHEILPALLD